MALDLLVISSALAQIPVTMIMENISIWECNVKVGQDRQFYAKQLPKENHSLTIV